MQWRFMASPVPIVSFVGILWALLATMGTYSYSREDLLSIQTKCVGARIPLKTYHLLQDYGILCSVKPTHRGYRSFKKRQHRIPTLVSYLRPLHQSRTRGCDSRNWISLTPAPLHTKFSTLNARSIRNKTTDIVELVQDNDIDILALTETWLKDDE